MGESLKQIGDFLLRKANELKPQVDRFIDPAMVFFGTNALGLYLTEQGASIAAKKIDSFEGLVYYGLTALGTAGLVFANKHEDFGLIAAIKKLYKKRTKQAEPIVGLKPVPKRFGWTKTALLVGLTTLGGYQANKSIDRLINPKNTLMELSRREQDNRTLHLAGYKLTGLYSDITGIAGIVPTHYTPNTNRLMERAWHRKLKKSSTNPVIKQTIKERVEPFMQKQKTYMTLEEAIESTDEAIDPIKKELDWEGFGKSKGLSEEKIDLLREIASSIDGTMLMSYAMTELLPEANGMKNKAVLDYAFRAHGQEFLNLFPALGDDLASFDPFQFTSYAVFDSKHRCEGASQVSRFLPKDLQIPGSVIKLKGDDHNRAAFMFGIHNLALYLRLAKDDNVESLKRLWKDNKMVITQYIATAHHSPRLAVTSLSSWLKDPSKTYESVARGRLKIYAKKTRSNLNALLTDDFEIGPFDPADRITGVFEDLNETNSAGYEMFAFIAPKNITPKEIANKFSSQNTIDLLEAEKIVDYDGNPVEDVFEGEQVYILSAPFKDTGKINSQGKEVFIYRPLKTDSRKQILERFKRYAKGRYINPDITDKFGKFTTIRKGMQVYVRAYGK